MEVSDPLPEFPHERVARPGDEGGRGLQLVARTTRRWGTRPGDVGKTVWFELAVPKVSVRPRLKRGAVPLLAGVRTGRPCRTAGSGP
ncbi:hypothetical protein SHIRM173S_01973 [Streptomyces hirsutus]